MTETELDICFNIRFQRGSPASQCAAKATATSSLHYEIWEPVARVKTTGKMYSLVDVFTDQSIELSGESLALIRYLLAVPDSLAGLVHKAGGVPVRNKSTVFEGALLPLASQTSAAQMSADCTNESVAKVPSSLPLVIDDAAGVTNGKGEIHGAVDATDAHPIKSVAPEPRSGPLPVVKPATGDTPQQAVVRDSQVVLVPTQDSSAAPRTVVSPPTPTASALPIQSRANSPTTRVPYLNKKPLPSPSTLPNLPVPENRAHRDRPYGGAPLSAPATRTRNGHPGRTAFVATLTPHCELPTTSHWRRRLDQHLSGLGAVYDTTFDVANRRITFTMPSTIPDLLRHAAKSAHFVVDNTLFSIRPANATRSSASSRPIYLILNIPSGAQRMDVVQLMNKYSVSGVLDLVGQVPHGPGKVSQMAYLAVGPISTNNGEALNGRFIGNNKLQVIAIWNPTELFASPEKLRGLLAHYAHTFE
ncbi:hypothetical protein GGF32_009007 [Allomyces javanicus]|nr:hypothetical protein GGF32_009007 [Allomyces javanicus]